MVETLSKFGVPMGADGTEGRGGILQPKQKHKFRVIFTNFGLGGARSIDLSQQIMTIAKPSLQYESIQLDAYNSRAWVQGKHTWQTIEIVLRDDVTNNVSSSVGYQLQKQLNHFEQTSPRAGHDYKFGIQIEQLDGSNNVSVDNWDIEGAFITDVNYDQGDYSSGDVLTVTMTVQFDNATHGTNFEHFPRVNHTSDLSG